MGGNKILSELRKVYDSSNIKEYTIDARGNLQKKRMQGLFKFYGGRQYRTVSLSEEEDQKVYIQLFTKAFQNILFPSASQTRFVWRKKGEFDFLIEEVAENILHAGGKFEDYIFTLFQLLALSGKTSQNLKRIVKLCERNPEDAILRRLSEIIHKIPEAERTWVIALFFDFQDVIPELKKISNLETEINLCRVLSALSKEEKSKESIREALFFIEVFKQVSDTANPLSIALPKECCSQFVFIALRLVKNKMTDERKKSLLCAVGNIPPKDMQTWNKDTVPMLQKIDDDFERIYLIKLLCCFSPNKHCPILIANLLACLRSLPLSKRQLFLNNLSTIENEHRVIAVSRLPSLMGYFSDPQQKINLLQAVGNFSKEEWDKVFNIASSCFEIVEDRWSILNFFEFIAQFPSLQRTEELIENLFGILQKTPHKFTEISFYKSVKSKEELLQNLMRQTG